MSYVTAAILGTMEMYDHFQERKLDGSHVNNDGKICE